MKTEIKDVIHFYKKIPVEISVAGYPTEGTLEQYLEVDNDHMPWRVKFKTDGLVYPQTHKFSGNEIKPVLRKLSSMTEEEAIHIKRILNDNHGIETVKTVIVNRWHLGHVGANASQMFEITAFLLSKGFDLWNLIDRGLAIERKTL